jgi:hypothetical protein
MSITGLNKFPNLTNSAFINNIGKGFYLGCIKVKDNMVKDFYSNEEQHPLYAYETLDQAQHPGKGNTKHKYHGTKKIKDKDMGLEEEVEGDFPMKKYVTISADIKWNIQFLLVTYINDIHTFYKSNKYVLPSNTEELQTKIVEHCTKCNAYPVAQFIFTCVDKYYHEKHMPGAYGGMDTIILDKASNYFKNEADQAPKGPLIHLIDQFVKFLSIIQVDLVANMFLCPTRKTVNIFTLVGLLNSMNEKLSSGRVSSEYVKTLLDFVVANKEASSKKKPDGEPGAKKGKAPAKKPSSGKGRGRPKGKTSKAASESDEDNISDVDDALNEMDDERDKYEDYASDEDLSN